MAKEIILKEEEYQTEGRRIGVIDGESITIETRYMNRNGEWNAGAGTIQTNRTEVCKLVEAFGLTIFTKEDIKNLLTQARTDSEFTLEQFKSSLKK